MTGRNPGRGIVSGPTVNLPSEILLCDQIRGILKINYQSDRILVLSFGIYHFINLNERNKRRAFKKSPKSNHDIYPSKMMAMNSLNKKKLQGLTYVRIPPLLFGLFIPFALGWCLSRD
jgi:hypothetical protein